MSSEQNLEKAGADLRGSASAMPVPQMRVRKPIRQSFMAFAAGLAVALIIGIPFYLTRTGLPEGLPVGAAVDTTTTLALDTTTTSTPPTTATTSPAPLTCGSELPYQVTLPEDLTGPHVGPSPHATDPAEAGQLILHWLGRDGSVEIRWPANGEYMEDAVWGDDASERTSPEPDWPMFIGPVLPDVDGADGPIVASVMPTSAMTGPCDASQLAIYAPSRDGQEPDLVGATFGTGDQEGLVIYPGLARPRDKMLIVETIETDTIPEVRGCDGGPEAESIPKKSGTTPDGPVFTTPEEALRALLATDTAESWPDVGYFELVAPDGTITYGNPYDDNSPDPRPENGLVVSVTVIEVEGGWTVTGWETSGC